MSHLRILTLNTWKSPDVLDSLLNTSLTTQQLDILLLQEPPLSLPTSPHWKTLLPSQYSLDSHSTNPPRSIILVNSRIHPASITQLLVPDTGDVVAMDLKVGDSVIRIVSVYNPCKSSEAATPLSSLFSSSSPPYSIVSGDFNARHSLWEPSLTTTPTQDAITLADTFLSLELQPLLPPGTITYPKSSAPLDLVMGSSATAERIVRCSLAPRFFDVASDHLPLLTVLNLTPTTQDCTPRLNFKRNDPETLKKAYLEISKPRLLIPPSLSSQQEIDDEVERLTEDLNHAISASTPYLRPSSFSEPWWSKEIENLVRVAASARNFAFSHRDDEGAQARAVVARKHKKAAIIRAKRQYQTNLIENITDQTLFQVLRRSQNRSSSSSLPPLVNPDSSFAVSFSDKVSLLRSTLLPSSLAVAPAPPSHPQQKQSGAYKKGAVVGEVEARVDRGGVEGAARGGEEGASGGEVSVGEARESLEVWLEALEELPVEVEESVRGEDDEEWNGEDVEWSVAERRGRSRRGLEVCSERSGVEREEETNEDEEERNQTPSKALSQFTIPLPQIRLTEQNSATKDQTLKTIENLNEKEKETNENENLNKIASQSPSLSSPSSLSRYIRSPSISPPPHSLSLSDHSPPSSPLNPRALPFTPPLSVPSYFSYSSPSVVSSLFSDSLFTSILFTMKPSKASGPSNIPISILRSLWPDLQHRLSSIFRACLQLGYHPSKWRSYLGIVLRKPQKDNYSLPKSYRLIAILETMSKVLETAVEKQMRWELEREGKLAKMHFGGRKGRGVEDAVMWLISKVKDCWQDDKVVLALSLDAKNAFPSVNKQKLLDILTQLNILTPLLPWLDSFLSDRTCHLVVEGVVSPPLDGNCGLPQGSPLSPLLYIAYNSSLLQLLDSDSTSGAGYIDDVVALSWGKTVEEATEKMQGKMGKVESWGIEHDTVLEPSKSHLMVLMSSRKRGRWKKAGGREDWVKVELGQKVVPVTRAMKVLGCLVDDELDFKEFVRERVVKGTRVLGGLTALSSTTKGVSLRHARMLVNSCVLPRLDFLSAVWWSKMGRFSSFIQLFDQILRPITRFISGGLRNSSLPALCFSSFLLPTLLRLEYNAFRSALRHRTLPSSHPLYPFILNSRTQKKTPPNPSPIQLFHAHLPLLRSIPSIKSLNPSHTTEPISSLPLPPLLISDSKESALTSHNQLRLSAPPDSLFFYTDGSLIDGSSGAGVVVHSKSEDGNWEASGGKGQELGVLRTVYEAELVGISMALEVILGMVKDEPRSNFNFYILADNQSALLNALSPLHSPGQQLRAHILSLYTSILQASPSVALKLVWVPGHQGIEGNEEADEWAKKAAMGELEGDIEVVGSGSQASRVKERRKLDDFLNLPKSSTAILAHYKDLLYQRWREQWQQEPTSKHIRRIDLHSPSAHILRLHENLPRPLTSLLTQLRSGHSFLHADLYRSKRSLTDRCFCGAREDLSHFFLSCPYFATQRKQLVSSLGPLATNLPYLLSSPYAIPHTLRYTVSTGRFPRYHSNKILSREKKGKAAKAQKNKVGRTGNAVKKKKMKSGVVRSG